MTITVSTADPRSVKALAVLETADRWLKIRRKSDGAKFYVVPGSNGRVYWTNLQECSCPDFLHRGGECKHRLAVALHVARVNAEPKPKARKPIPSASIPDTFAAAPPVDGTAADLRREIVANRRRLAAIADAAWGVDGE